MSDEEIRQTTELLSKLDAGYVPYPIFEQLARIIALPILELVPYRITDGKIEVLLLNRGANDPIWPNMWHTPGTVIRATDLDAQDKDLDIAFERLVKDELADTAMGPVSFVASLLHESKRGVEQAQVYCAELQEEPRVGKPFAIDALPTDLIAQQHDFISKVEDYVRTTR